MLPFDDYLAQVRDYIERFYRLMESRKIRIPVSLGIGVLGMGKLLFAPLDPNGSPIAEQAVTRVGECFLGWLLISGLGYLGLSFMFGSVRRWRLKKQEVERRAQVRRYNEGIEFMRQYPLTNHHFCPSCGWLGYLPGVNSTHTGSKVAGGMAAAGGTGIAAMGCGGGCLGIFLILIGIPLLFLWGAGLIPIILGFVLISAGGSAAAAGATVASSGAGMSSNANMASQAAQNAPKQCPTCRNTGVIPANSPGAVHYYQTVPAYQNEAQRVAHEVLSQLPLVIDETPELSGGSPGNGTH